VAETPEETGALRGGHGGPGFARGGYGEGGGEDGRWARWWLKEDLVLGRDGGVFVAMAAALAYVLVLGKPVSPSCKGGTTSETKGRGRKHTDFTGVVEIN
jgi:hypothetical protein